jgi:electron transfer flavoprotein beta subunit
MNTIVCVKQIPQIYIKNGYSPKTRGIVSDGLVYVLSPHDEAAVEAALRQKKAGGGDVTVITIGPSRAEGALRWCLAMGVDRAVHILDDNGEDLDPWTRASILAETIKAMDYDLLLFGKKALDDEMGLVGTFVGELLELPVCTAVIQIELLETGGARIQRALERGNREEMICPIPAVLTVDQKLNRPRYPTFPARKAAQTASIRQIDIASLTAPFPSGPINVVRLAAPRVRPKKILAPDSDMSADDQLRFVMTGGMGKKKGGSVGGDPKQMASGIIDFLKEENVIDAG